MCRSSVPNCAVAIFEALPFEAFFKIVPGGVTIAAKKARSPGSQIEFGNAGLEALLPVCGPPNRLRKLPGATLQPGSLRSRFADAATASKRSFATCVPKQGLGTRVK